MMDKTKRIRIVLKVDVPYDLITAGNNIMMKKVKYYFEESLRKQYWENICVTEIVEV